MHIRRRYIESEQSPENQTSLKSWLSELTPRYFHQRTDKVLRDSPEKYPPVKTATESLWGISVALLLKLSFLLSSTFFFVPTGNVSFCIAHTSSSQCGTAQSLWKIPSCVRGFTCCSLSPPPRLCSILWVSFVFLILLRGFSAVSHGEWTRPGLKTLSWRCFFCFFLDNALCVFHWSWCTLCTITVAGPELCYWDPFKLCGRHYPITDGSILSSRH